MTKLKTLNLDEKQDYEKIGLMCGIEIHQQLNTGKLFCSCPCEIVPNETLDKEIHRKLRFSLSETGEIDRAAMQEFKKKKSNIYKYNNKIACLVDLDEEPPHAPNKNAISTAIRVGIMLNLKFFDKIQFMRKLIIDGSVTGGFQRTSMLGFGGYLDTSFGKVEILGINVEEDSSRNLERNNGQNIYSLDRQGIPLIEITTGPQIKTPEGGFETAQKLGNLLRSFPETKRGIGTIRQDLNVSITGGSRIEIKGAQNLKLIPEIIKAEIRRQQILLSIIEELKERNITIENFSDNTIYDVTNIIGKSESKVIQSNLKNKDDGVFAIKLKGFNEILGHELHPNYRFASEVSDRNKKHFPTIKGLFHTDELPKYGITKQEVDAVKQELKLEDNDAFILIANNKKIAKESLLNVIEIIKELMQGVPEEVRQVDPKGTLTTFSRPMPGAARMYPETDVPDIVLKDAIIETEKENLPELYNEKLARIKDKWSLEENKIEEILTKFNETEFDELLKLDIKPAGLYSLIFELPKEVKKREKLEIVELSFELIKQIIEANLNKNNLYELHKSIYKENISNLDNLEKYLEEKGLIQEEIDEAEIENKLKEIISQNQGAPMGALMGKAMQAFNGQVEGKVISQKLRELM